MATTTDGYTMLFEVGSGNGYWCIEDNQQSQLCITSNAMTREVVTPWMYSAGWNAEELRTGLANDGVPAEVIDRFLTQAGLTKAPE